MNESALANQRTLAANPHGRLLTFGSVGWVFLLAGVIALGILAYVVLHTMARASSRPPGDGRTLDSYLFALSPNLIPLDRITRGHPVRDLFPAMTDPPTLRGSDMAAENQRIRKAYLVPADRIVGVNINGESRAYPISVLNCHEIVNDTLGGAAIAVTYNMLCDSVVVFDRRPLALPRPAQNGDASQREGSETPLEFGVSGLLYNSNLLMYDRKRAGASAAAPAPGGESLWSQLLCKSVTGPASEAGQRLRVLPMAVTTWGDWLERHPETTVILRDPSRMDCYRDSATFASRYFNDPRLKIPLEPAPGSSAGAERPPKSRIAAVTFGDHRRVYDLADLANRADAAGAADDEVAGLPIRLTCRWDPRTNIPTFAAELTGGVDSTSASDAPRQLEVIYAFWFAWHAMWPDDLPGR